ETDDTTPAACASRMPSFTPDDSPKSSAFTTRRPPLGVAPPPVIPTDARQVAQHGRRIGREAHGARLVVVAILHRRLPYPEPVFTRDVQQLDIEPEPGDGEAREDQLGGTRGEGLEPGLRVQDPGQERDAHHPVEQPAHQVPGVEVMKERRARCGRPPAPARWAGAGRIRSGAAFRGARASGPPRSAQARRPTGGWETRPRRQCTRHHGRLGIPNSLTKPLHNSARGAGGRGGGRFTREGATKAELGGAEQARAGTRPRGVFRSALACRRLAPTPSATITCGEGPYLHHRNGARHARANPALVPCPPGRRR